MDNELHPELARETGQVIQQQHYQTHPSLMSQMEAQQEPTSPSLDSLPPLPAGIKLPQSEPGEIEEFESAPEPELMQVQESPKDRQWKEVKKKADMAKHLEREKEQLEREVAFYKEQATKQQTRQHTEDDEYLTDSERKMNQRLADIEARALRAEQDARAAQQQAAVSRAQQRLQQDFPDMSEVLSDDNIQRLKDEYPHLYNAAISSPDVYNVGATAYELIIAKGIAKKQPTAMNPIAQARNNNKPRSASTVRPQSGATPIQQASNFMGNSISSEEERKALYAEMVNSSRNKVF